MDRCWNQRRVGLGGPGGVGRAFEWLQVTWQSPAESGLERDGRLARPAFGEDAVEHDDVCMQIQVGRRTKALNEANRAGATVAKAALVRARAVKAE